MHIGSMEEGKGLLVLGEPRGPAEVVASRRNRGLTKACKWPARRLRLPRSVAKSSSGKCDYCGRTQEIQRRAVAWGTPVSGIFFWTGDRHWQGANKKGFEGANVGFGSRVRAFKGFFLRLSFKTEAGADVL